MGAAEGQVYVSFGPGPTEEIPVEWAELMLTQLKSEDPQRFGRLLTRVMGWVK